MEIKIFEVRDRMTMIPVLAVNLDTEKLSDKEQYLIGRVGIYPDGVTRIQVTDLELKETKFNPYAWTSNRTVHEAHKYMERNWDDLVSGQVLDIQYILGETDEPVKSEF